MEGLSNEDARRILRDRSIERAIDDPRDVITIARQVLATGSPAVASSTSVERVNDSVSERDPVKLSIVPRHKAHQASIPGAYFAR